MKIDRLESHGLLIEEAPNLDPIRVWFYADESPGSGGVVIHCYNRVWSAWWGAMGAPVRDFMREQGPHYLAACLQRGLQGVASRTAIGKETAYLVRIIEAVQEALTLAEIGEL